MPIFEMTLSRAEFLRLLPAAVGPGLVADGDGFLRLEGGRSLRITLAGLPPLTLGTLSLERLRVELSFKGYAEEEKEVCLERFRRTTQRGGG